MSPIDQPVFTAYHFDELSKEMLYDILALRAEVFVVEQASPYMDFDYLDQQAIHLCLTENDKLIGYSRLLAAGLKFDEASIGRIIVAANHRASGLGRTLVARSIEQLHACFGNTAIRIEAQNHLHDFYAGFGFITASDIYDWGGIPHIKMVKAA